jgi:hypothetical protein
MEGDAMTTNGPKAALMQRAYGAGMCEYHLAVGRILDGRDISLDATDRFNAWERHQAQDFPARARKLALEAFRAGYHREADLWSEIDSRRMAPALQALASV